tara:strand:- start:97 stop:513 length:417 start_codon:yes stop_codon:yes gene_type:complete
MKEELDIEKLEDIKVSFDKEAFQTNLMHCDNCNKEMKVIKTEIDLPNSFISVKLNIAKCTKCKKEYLNSKEAKKLDKALTIARLMDHNTFKIKKSLSFDGDNYIFRIPSNIAKNLGKKPYADLIPLSSKDLLIHLKEN